MNKKKKWGGGRVWWGGGGGRVGGGQDGCERRIESFFAGGRVLGSRVRGVRVDVNEELRFLGAGEGRSGSGGQGGLNKELRFLRKLRGWGAVWVRGGGVRVRGGGQGGCDRRIEVFVKIQKKNWGGGGGRGVGWGGQVGCE